MTTSPERCLGSLMKDLDKDLSPRDFDFESKDTAYKTSSEQKLSLDSIYSFNSKSSSLSENNKFFSQRNNSSQLFTKFSILSAFNNQRSTIILQKGLKEASKETINIIIKELSGSFRDIIRNKNGNYFCSDLFKVCDKNQRILILKELSNTISDDCVDEFGTHSIQTLVELAKCEEEYKLILSSFNDYDKVLTASLNQNGSFVILKIIVNIPEGYRMEFNLKFIKFLCILSLDMYGVCAVKKFIGYSKNELLIKQILKIILTNFVNISENQYGNYLIQYILEHWWNTQEGTSLKKICISNFYKLAENHFSSYICELFIKLASFEEKQLLMSSLIKEKSVTLLTNNSNGSIIINKLINSLKNKKDANTSIKKNPLSLNNIRAFCPKRNKEKNEEEKK